MLWDFDETLAYRPGRIGGAMLDVLDREEPRHGVTRDTLRPHLAHGFPWHTPEIGHPELSTPELWWEALHGTFARAYAAAGVRAERAPELARLAAAEYVDPTHYRLFEDTRPALEELRARGWCHVVLSNHVPELPDIVSALGLDDLLDAVVTSAVSGYEKPHAEAYRAGLAAAGNPEYAVMVGDNPVADVTGAEAFGLRAVLVRRDDPRARLRAPDLQPAVDVIDG